MDAKTARSLIALDNRFYADHAASFSATRSTPWAGWTQLVEALGRTGWLTSRRELSVLDLACGNLRFERFLSKALPGVRFHITALDACPALAGDAGLANVEYRQLDILSALFAVPDASPELADRPCELAVCFGFMHHVPGAALRRRVLDALLDATAAGGMLAISFWSFMDDPRLAAKARAADSSALEMPPFPRFSAAALDDGDHFLGWQRDPSALRYCHHFDEREIDGLAAHAASHGAHEVARFSADGASGALNRYLLLAREPPR